MVVARIAPGVSSSSQNAPSSSLCSFAQAHNELHMECSHCQEAFIHDGVQRHKIPLDIFQYEVVHVLIAVATGLLERLSQGTPPIDFIWSLRPHLVELRELVARVIHSDLEGDQVLNNNTSTFCWQREWQVLLHRCGFLVNVGPARSTDFRRRSRCRGYCRSLEGA